MKTFSVKNYEKFQHYKDRSPPWIKLYNELLDDYEFGLLPDASKMHLVAIWLLASRSENKIPLDPEWVAKRINATEAVNLQLLTDRKFILVDQGVQGVEHVASKPRAKRVSRERVETETERERETEQIGGGDVPATPKPAEPRQRLISEEAFALAPKLLSLMGVEDGHPISVAAPYTVQCWFNGGWPEEAIKAGVQRAMQSKGGDPPSTLKYFEKAIARSHAEMTRALPVVNIVQGETITERSSGKAKPGGSLSASIDADLARSIEEDRRLAGHEGTVLCLPPGSVH